MICAFPACNRKSERKVKYRFMKGQSTKMLGYFLICCLLLYTDGRPSDRRDDDVAGVSPEWENLDIRATETLMKGSNDDDEAGETEGSIADISGAGSGETDTDMLSGDNPSRSLVESKDDDDEDEDDNDNAADAVLQRQLHEHPAEMIDIKPKETADQPYLNDFPDKDDTAGYTKGTSASQKDVDNKKNKSLSDSDDVELDDIKIEEILNPKKNDKKKKKKKAAIKEKASSKVAEGKISFVLQQNFNVLYEKKDSPSYQMLTGNIKKDIEKMIKGVAVDDVTFSEVSVEGNPRQSGKTKANFNIKASDNVWMKELLKLVDSGDIDGLRVIKGSLEIEEE